MTVVQVSSTSSTVDDDDEFCWQRDRLAVARDRGAILLGIESAPLSEDEDEIFQVPDFFRKVWDLSFGDAQISLKQSVG